MGEKRTCSHQKRTAFLEYWLKKIREKTIEEVRNGNKIVQAPIMQQKIAERKINPVKIKYKDMELEIPWVKFWLHTHI